MRIWLTANKSKHNNTKQQRSLQQQQQQQPKVVKYTENILESLVNY